MRDIKIQPTKKMAQQKKQVKINKSPLQKEIFTKKIQDAIPEVSKKETPHNIAKIQRKTSTPYIGETWVERKASAQDGKKRRCIITLVFADGGISYVQTVSKIAFEMGDLCPPYIQELGAFMGVWEKLPSK